jgi:PAS domain S-box-containing protein
LSRISIYLARTAAILVLFGWQTDSIFLKQLSPEIKAMNPMVAVAFICCAVSLLLQGQTGYRLLFAKALAVLVMLGAIVRLCAVAGLFNAGIDRLLFAPKVQATLYNGLPNNIAPHAAFCFLLLGASLFFLHHKRINASQWLALPVNGFGILSVIGYCYHLAVDYTITSFIPMALNTGVCLMLFSMSVLLVKSRQGFMAQVTNNHAGGRAARLLLPALIIVPAVLGYAVLAGIFHEKFSVVVWIALFVCIIIFMFGLVIWLTAYSINRSEIKRLQQKQLVDKQQQEIAELKIRQSQQRYFTLMNSVDGIVWEADAQTFAFTFVSEQAQRMLGYPVERWMNEPDFWQQHIHEEDRTWAVNYCAQTTAKGQSHQFEYRMIAADGRILWLRDIVAVILENNKPVRLSGIMVDITEQKQMEKELQEKELSQQKLITEITILAQEKERNELGLELHDNINQLLSVVKLYLGVAKTEKTFNEEIIDRSYLHLEEAMQDIRKLSHTLVAPSLGHDGLKEALEDLVDSVKESNNIKLQLQVDEDYDALEVDKNKELMLYRIVQEQMNNILKYAKADEVSICIQQKGNYLRLNIRDNGVGFDPLQTNTGIGLKNISSRVSFYNGNMNLVSAPGNGCMLEVSIPN